MTYLKPMNNSILNSILLVILSLSFLACSPKDKNLNRPFFNKANGGKGLRVGAYGQTIWAAQNVVQVGALVNGCLKLEGNPIKETNGVFEKSCKIKFQVEKKITEGWDIKLNLSENNVSSVVLSAEGKLEKGAGTSKFKSDDVFLVYDEKTFKFTSNEANQFALELNSAGGVGTNADEIKFSHQIKSQGEIKQDSWAVNNLEHNLELPQRSQKFTVTSKALNLTWVNLLCAEISGEMEALETGRPPALIALNKTEAIQVGKKWTQAFNGCAARTMTELNFEFLFF